MEDSGVLLINKPQGITSQDVLTKLKKTLNIKKIGHAGTLDPLAKGVLVVLCNEATKLSDYLLMNEKTYQCEIKIGLSSTTEDCEGEIIEEKEVNNLSENEVDNVLISLLGKQEQIPPMYSSVHHQGKKLYELARKGIEVERKSREIEIYNIKRISHVKIINHQAIFSFETKVSKGTYIRTLCVEIGKRLGYPSLMNQLTRIKSGIFSIENSFTLDDIYNNNYKLISMVDSLKGMYQYEVDELLRKDILNGKPIYQSFNSDIVVFTYHNNLLAIYQKDNEKYKAKRVWC